MRLDAEGASPFQDGFKVFLAERLIELTPADDELNKLGVRVPALGAELITGHGLGLLSDLRDVAGAQLMGSQPR